LIVQPSEDFAETCGRCHANIASTMSTSLHANFTGYTTLFEMRAGEPMSDHLEHEFEAECGKCHTSCGECHVSYPVAVGGGLLDGNNHAFLGTPDTKDNCASCHGSRINEEYFREGNYFPNIEGYYADVHYIPGGFRSCMDCHTGEEMHGDGNEYQFRYAENDMPRCEDCHSTVTYGGQSVAFGSEGDNLWHQTHGLDDGSDHFQCQVCHSQDYKNCQLCHVGGTGVRQPHEDNIWVDFKIAKRPTEEVQDPVMDVRSYDYFVVRHIPIAPDTYVPEPFNYVELSQFDALPTWKYASPHNIRTWTARTDTTAHPDHETAPLDQKCGYACHNTPDDVSGWFLREADLQVFSEWVQGYPVDAIDFYNANAPYAAPDGDPSTWSEGK
jgi:thiosulfate/3-mercaptopyruvate sulfurtransferase